MMNASPESVGAWSVLPVGLDDLTVADFPRFEYSMRAVRRVGDALKGDLHWSDDRADELKEMFRIANNWRDSHAYPMAKLRSEMIGKIRSLDLNGLTAARLKRMRSIRKKLRTQPQNFSQIQDLGGCRAILPSMQAVKTLVSAYRGDASHEVAYENDYIADPKRGGYRCHHLILKFKGAEAAQTIFDGRRIEVQVRTRLQHSWATAVEAVGTFRGEDMKGGVGDADWLRLFLLMSGELAVAENCPEPPGIPNGDERKREIKALNQRLKALNTLENLRQAVRFTDHYAVKPEDAPRYFLIKYDNEKMTVDVQPHFYAVEGTISYDSAEQADIIADTNRFNTVLVEAFALASLKEAYPNYFGDVQLFKRNLQHIVDGKPAKEYTAPPRIVEPPSHFIDADISWMRRTGKRRWRNG